MRRALTAAFAVLWLLASAGCTIHVHNTSSRTAEHSLEEWHQCGLFRLELSDPIDLSTKCPTGWTEITTGKNVGQLVLTALSFTLYDPWTFQISCLKQSNQKP